MSAAFDPFFARMAVTTSPATLLIGVGDLPPDIEPTHAMRVVPRLADLLENVAGRVEDADGVRALLGSLHVALMVCRRAAAPRRGLALIRLVVSNLVTAGWTQEARDLAEHALALVSGDAVSMRIAWSILAEVSHRVGDLHEALVRAALASTFVDVAFDRSEVWTDGFLATRILRDLGLYEAAEVALAQAADALGEHAKREPISTRIDAVRLSIAHRRIHTQGDDPDRVRELVSDLADNLERAIALEDDVLPPLVILVQLMVHDGRPVTVCDRDVGALIDAAAARVPPSLRDYLGLLRDPAPRLEQIEQMLTNKSAARFRPDLAYDIRAAALLARRALLRAPTLETADVLALLDLLTDRTLPTTAAGPLIDAPRTRAGLSFLRGGGQHVVVLGLDEQQRLVRLDAGTEASTVVVREDEGVFNSERFRTWTHDPVSLRAGTFHLPFAYAFMDGAAHMMGDDVRRSVDGVGTTIAGVTPLAIVADVALHPFPLHLLRCNANFLGDVRPVCSVPSLEWIADVAAGSRRTSTARVAWVSDVSSPDDAAVLAPLADRLESILTDHGIDLTRSAEPPPDLAGAALSIVIAHGGLVPEQRYFQVVRDDGQGRWSGRHLTAALRGTEVVVLFVCSGGRLDPDPRGQAMVGMPRHLLASGCRAVVGSPWPLAVEVPPRWLPTFLDEVDAGAMVTDAVFKANQAVSRWTSGNAPHSLAMHLFGDPTVRVPPRASESA